MINVEKEIEMIHERFDKMTNKEFLRDVLCLNGRMTNKLFAKVIEEVKNQKHIDDESIAYFPEKYNITREEFADVFNYLTEIGDKAPKCFIEESDGWPTRTVFFEYSKSIIKHELICGQGSISSLDIVTKLEFDKQYKGKYRIRHLPASVDRSIRFYKRLK